MEDAKTTSNGETDPSKPPNFEKLIEKESKILDRDKNASFNRCPKCSNGQEPWLEFTSADRFGVALSGGGIRSATFNLGVLQGLHSKRMLKHIDYLSTVSGGGYVGGFWTAWLHRGAKRGESAFPDNQSGSRGTDTREIAEIRHLREFSRFLMPRLGFFSADMWAGVMAIISGAIPALLLASAVIILGLFGWAAFASPILRTSWLAQVVGITGLTALTWVVLRKRENGWRKANVPNEQDKDARKDRNWYVTASIFAAASVALIWTGGLMAKLLGVQAFEACRMGLFPEDYRRFNVILFEPAIVWVVLTLLLIALRIVAINIPKFSAAAAALNRVATRLFAMAVIWCAIGLVWEAAVYVSEFTWFGKSLTGATGVGAGGIFVALQKWLTQEPSKARAEGLVSRLKPMLPQIAANIAVFLMAVLLLTAVFFSGTISGMQGLVCYLWGGGAIVVLGLGCFLYDPQKVGLHDFYRSKISRAYLGASNQPAADAKNLANRMTAEQPGDDLKISSLEHRPLHLVCCAANCLSGDPLQTLYRGGRSAVVSPIAVSLGDSYQKSGGVRFSSVLTASAAAFNSNMGSLSMKLGPAVTFLMSALNLRLGLWLPNPAVKASNPESDDAPSPILPGLFLLKEMFGQTNCDSSYMHLSDGGHFENLGLYELIRRHCRYVIVCDATADPDVAFDDFGNALRRIREDFGVQIEINLEQLRPDANQVSKQHIAVGTIHYNGNGGTDKGTLVYFKPTLTGDEPYDVQQYHSRNRVFPHETTGDQFYDEAQWESYRRLGQHCIDSAFRFVERMPKDDQERVERIFQQARQEWYPFFGSLETNFLELTERCSELEGEIRDNAPETLRREFFPEVAVALTGPGSNGSNGDGNETVEDTEKILYYLLQVIQVMEDAWVGCRLDEYWNHPLNLGWVNYMQRWASTESIHRWWPILAPIYGTGFQRFAGERFGLKMEAAQFELKEIGTECKNGLARQTRQRQEPRAIANEGKTYELLLTLAKKGDKSLKPVQVGYINVQIKDCEISWKSSDLYVLPSLQRTEITGKFLDQLIAHLSPTHRITVQLCDTGRTGLGDRQQMVDLIAFYKSRGFSYDYVTDTSDKTGEIRYLCLERSSERKNRSQQLAAVISQ